jgi:hypothetical protein
MVCARSALRTSRTLGLFATTTQAQGQYNTIGSNGWRIQRGPQCLAWLGLAWLGLAWLGLAWLGLDWIGLAASFACLVCAYVSEEDVERRLAVADEVSVKPSEVRCGGETWDQREWKLGHERRVQPLKVIEPPEDERRLVVQFDGDFVPGMVS